jgi:MoxR-like ATPase
MEAAELNEMVRAGLSPRAEIVLAQAGRVVAWMNGRGFVLPSDIQETFLDICTHRFFLSRFSRKHRTDLAKEILRGILEKIPSPSA